MITFYSVINYVFYMWLFQLSAYLHESRLSARSTYYRHQTSLNRPLKSIDLSPFPLGRDWLHVLTTGLQCGSLEPDDWSEREHQNIQRILNSLSRGKPYIQMLLNINHIYLSYENSTLLDFLKSSDGRAWYMKTKKLTHRQRFALETGYRATPRKALSHELHVKDLLRKEPLLRYKDLVQLKVHNAQAIYESFEPFLMTYRSHRLEYIKQNLF